MAGILKIRDCYAGDGYLVVLRDGELGVHMYCRQCEGSHQTGDKAQTEDAAKTEDFNQVATAPR